MTIKILSITSHTLRSGVYKLELPEIMALSTIIERDSWHLDQSVLDHAIKVVENIERLLRLPLIPCAELGLSSWCSTYLQERIGESSREEHLNLAAVLHDIGKPSTFSRDSSGNTSCPGHEVLGAAMVREFAQRFSLDILGQWQVARIIRYHGFVQDVITLAIAGRDERECHRLLSLVIPDLMVESLILAYADILGSDLASLSPREFELRSDKIKFILELCSDLERDPVSIHIKQPRESISCQA